MRHASDKDLEQFQNMKSILLISLMSCRVINLESKIGSGTLHTNVMYTRCLADRRSVLHVNQCFGDRYMSFLEYSAEVISLSPQIHNDPFLFTRSDWVYVVLNPRRTMTIKQTLGEPFETLSVPDQALGDQVPIISAPERFGDRNGGESTYIGISYKSPLSAAVFPSVSVSQYFPRQGV